MQDALNHDDQCHHCGQEYHQPHGPNIDQHDLGRRFCLRSVDTGVGLTAVIGSGVGGTFFVSAVGPSCEYEMKASSSVVEPRCGFVEDLQVRVVDQCTAQA